MDILKIKKYFQINRSKNLTGFTLVETLIYVALLGSVVGVFISFVLMASGLRNKMHAVNEVQANESFVQEIILYHVRNAKSVIAPAKSTNSPMLTIINRATDAEQSFFVTDGTLYFSDGTATTSVITNDVLIADLLFTNLAATNKLDNIQVSGKLHSFASSSQEYFYEENFKFNVSLPF